MFCGKCGQKIKEGNLFCIQCGAKVESIIDNDNFNFRDESQIFRFENLKIIDKKGNVGDELWIDVKFCIFRIISSNKNYDTILGYKFFNIIYNDNGQNFYVSYEDKSSNEIINLFTITSVKDESLKEIINILDKMANGYYENRFRYDFNDDLSIWEQANNERGTFTEFFSEDISDLKFTATYIEYNNFEGFIHNDSAEISLLVQNNGHRTNYNDLVIDDSINNEIILYITLESQEKICTAINFKELQYNLYLNLETASVFIGDLYNYISFEFDSEYVAQTLFNILAILENTNENLNFIDIPI